MCFVWIWEQTAIIFLYRINWLVFIIETESVSNGNHSQEDQLEGPSLDGMIDVRNDLKKMKLVKWVEQVQDRSKWKAIGEKAKTLSEL